MNDATYLYDRLTGLPQRALLVAALPSAREAAVPGASRNSAILIVGIDRLKLVAECLGSTVGDALLLESARRIQHRLRSRDIIARYDGESFGLVLEHVRDLDDAIGLARQILGEFAIPFHVEGLSMRVSASIGICMTDHSPRGGEQFVRDAALAMRRARKEGGGFSVASPELRERDRSNMRTEMDLCVALERGQLRLHYQPIVSLATGRVCGVEALVRWQKTAAELVSPGEFLAVAVEARLIRPIGAWVLREACRQMRTLQIGEGRFSHLGISVNVSHLQVRDPDFFALVADVLAETQLDPRSLTLEITETALMERSDTISVTLARLVRCGVRLELDDFGSAFSSMVHLRMFPLSGTRSTGRSSANRANGSPIRTSWARFWNFPQNLDCRSRPRVSRRPSSATHLARSAAPKVRDTIFPGR